MQMMFAGERRSSAWPAAQVHSLVQSDGALEGGRPQLRVAGGRPDAGRSAGRSGREVGKQQGRNDSF